MSTAKAEERISARVPSHVRDRIAMAAQAMGATVNQFLVQSAVEKATEVLERERVISLSSNDAKIVYALLDAPPAPSDALKSAVRSRKGLLCSR